MAGWLISRPSRRAAFIPPAAGYSKIPRRVGSTNARKMSFSTMKRHKHRLMCWQALPLIRRPERKD